MSETRKNDRKIKTALDNGSVVIPNLDDRDDSYNDYIESIIANTEASLQNEQLVSVEDNINNVHENNTDFQKNTSEDSILSSDDELPEKKSTDKALRKLTIFEIIVIAFLILLPMIQILFVCTVSAKIYIIYTAISLLFVVLLSISCKQYQMVAVHIVIAVWSAFVIFTGFRHGMITSDLSSKSIFKLSQINQNTPKKSKELSLDDLHNKFIYYYKYGCKDCLTIETQLDALLAENGCEVIPIETRSDFGKKMLESYPIDEVPAGLVIKEDGSFVIRVIYDSIDGKSCINDGRIYELFNALEVHNS